MATSNDHPGLPFVQAAGYTRGRPDGAPIWIVIHDMEASEHSARAESTAAYFANPGDGRQVSSHYCVDNNSVVQCVDLDDSAWTVGNRPGNYRGINWELSGFARQTTAEWLDAFGVAMFLTMAPIVRSDANRFRIPLKKVTVAELRSFTPGITSHYDLGLAFGGTDHTDPGPNFPWDHFINVMKGTDMAQYTLAREASTGQLYKCDGIWSQPIIESDLDDIRWLAKEGHFTLWNNGAIREGWFAGAFGAVIKYCECNGDGGNGPVAPHVHTLAASPATTGPVTPDAG